MNHFYICQPRRRALGAGDGHVRSRQRFPCDGKRPRVLRRRRHQSDVCVANVPLGCFQVVINLQGGTQRVPLTLETRTSAFLGLFFFLIKNAFFFPLQNVNNEFLTVNHFKYKPSRRPSVRPIRSLPKIRQLCTSQTLLTWHHSFREMQKKQQRLPSVPSTPHRIHLSFMLIYKVNSVSSLCKSCVFPRSHIK